MSIQQTIFTVLAIIIFLVIADLTGFTSGKNKLKKLLPFKKVKQKDLEKIKKKITEYELSDPFIILMMRWHCQIVMEIKIS